MEEKRWKVEYLDDEGRKHVLVTENKDCIKYIQERYDEVKVVAIPQH